MNSIKKELEKVGISSVGGEDQEEYEISLSNFEKFDEYQLDPEIKAVIVGLDTKFTYSKLCIASLYIQTGGAKFIACNDDAYDVV
jgi:ribonucleotide monophosphatase NagD (HAD superfamily)